MPRGGSIVLLRESHGARLRPRPVVVHAPGRAFLVHWMARAATPGCTAAHRLHPRMIAVMFSLPRLSRHPGSFAGGAMQSLLPMFCAVLPRITAQAMTAGPGRQAARDASIQPE